MYKAWPFPVLLGFLTGCGGLSSELSARTQEGAASVSHAAANRPAIQWAQLPLPLGSNITSIADEDISSIIDPSLSLSDQQLAQQALLSLPPYWRSQGVLVVDQAGNLHTSSRSLIRNSLAAAQSHAGGPPPSGGYSATSAAREMLTPSTVTCPGGGSPVTISLGGYGTGPFRRVANECTGYTVQTINFNSDTSGSRSVDCVIANAPTTSLDYILGGAYSTSSTAGIDAGFTYVEAGTKSYFGEIILVNGSSVYGTNLPCGGQYQVTLSLQAANSPGTSEFIPASSYVNPATGNGQSGTPIVKYVQSSNYNVNGTDFIFRRLTSIAQNSQNFSSGEWFGFAMNAAGGPNLQQPEIAYTASTVSNGNGQYQITTDFAAAERYPQVYNNVTGVLCSEDPARQPIDFNAYEGINLANPNVSGGSMYGTNCYTGQGT